jgi:hypothetical protein
MASLEHEHTAAKDAHNKFWSSNGLQTTSATEWEVVVAPKASMTYPERDGFNRGDPECRVPEGLDSYKREMEARNKQLAAAGHAPMVVEELVAGRLYTGPMCARVLPCAFPCPLVSPSPYLPSAQGTRSNLQ